MLTANWICSYVLNDMLAIHQNGTRTSSRKNTRPIQVSARVMTASPPVPQEIAADQDDPDHEDRHDEDRDRHAAAPTELVERHLVRVRGEHLGGSAGPAAGHHVDDVEVVDGEDEREQRGDDDHVLEPGQRD